MAPSVHRSHRSSRSHRGPSNGARIRCGLLALVGLGLLAPGCRHERPGRGLGEGPPQIGEDTHLLATFDPAALAGPGAGGVDLEHGVASAPPPVAPPVPVLPTPEVTGVEPTAIVDAYQDVSIRFNRPMVPLGEKLRGSAEELGFHFSPPIAGEAYWAEPTRLVFEPEDALPEAREFQVHFEATLQAVDGPTLDVERDWSFSTTGPTVDMRVEAESYDYGAADPRQSTEHNWKTPIYVDTTQNIGLAALRRATHAEAFDDEGRSTPVAIRVIKHVRTDAWWGTYGDYEILPKTHWPAGSEVLITIDAGLRGRAGPRPMGYRSEFSFRVAEGLRVTHLSCEQGEYDDGCELGHVLVHFSSPLRRSQVTRLSVGPSEAGTAAVGANQEYDWGRERALNQYWAMRMWGDLERNKDYTITLDPRITDIYGQAFVGERELGVWFVEPPPSMTLDRVGGTFVASQPALVGVDSRHVERLHLRVAVLNDAGAVDAFTTKRERFWPSEDQATFFDETLVLTHSGQFGFSSTTIDLARFTKGKPGIVMTSVESARLLPRAQGRAVPERLLGRSQITDLGLTSADSLPQGVVRVASLSTLQPLAGVLIEVIDARDSAEHIPQRVGKTDKNGLLRLPPELEISHTAYLRASLGDDRVYLQVGGVSPSPSSDRALESGETVLTSLMTDRPLYKPGESLRVMGWAAVASPYTLSGLRQLPPNTSVLISVQDVRGELVAERRVRAKTHGKFWATLQLPAAGALGDYTISASVLGHTDLTQVQVKDFVAPDFEVDAHADHADLHHGESTEVHVHASYYFGGDVPITRMRMTTRCVPQNYRPPGLDPAWNVGPRLPRYRHSTAGGMSAIRGTMGLKPDPERAALGRADYAISPNAPAPNLSAYCTHSLAVADTTQREVGAEVGVAMHPPHYLAHKLPKPAHKLGGYFEAGDSAQFAIQTLDFDASPLPVAQIRVELVRSWDEPRYETGDDGIRRFIGYEERHETLPVCKTHSGDDGQAHCSLPKLEPGNYEATITTGKSGAYQALNHDWFWVRSATRKRLPRLPVQTLKLDVSDPTPAVGDNIEVQVRVPWQRGSAMILMVKGGIHQIHTVDIRDGRGTLQLEVTDAWAPTVKFHSYAVRPADKSHNPLPQVEADRVSVEVGTDTRRLSVTLEVPALAQTGEQIPIQVRVRDSDGAPARGHVSVWAVDEALLALAPMQIPDFIETFVVHRPDKLSFSHSYSALLQPFSPHIDPYQPIVYDPEWAVGRGLGLWGSGSGSGYGGGRGSARGSSGFGSGGTPMPVRSSFSSAPIFIGDAVLDARGQARLEGELPDNLTTFRVMAVASSPITGGEVEARFGTTDARVRVTQPLVVRAALPRIMRAGDRAEVGVIVDNLGGGEGELDIEVALVDAQGILELVGEPKASAKIGANAQVRIPFTVRALATGTPQFEVHATLEPKHRGSPKVGDALRLPLPVEAERTLSDRVAVYGDLGDEDGGAALLPFVLPADADPNYGGLSVSVGSTILGGVEDAVAYLVQYPYGCVEQTSSSLLPLVPLGALAKQGYPLGIDDTDAYVRAGVERLASMQLAGGGFSYWPGGHEPAPFASAYATWVLTLAADKGYPVPRRMLDEADAYLLQLAAAWSRERAPGLEADIEAALILWTLAERGHAPAEGLDLLFERRARLPVFAKAMLTLATVRHDSDDPHLALLMPELSSTIDEREAVAKVETSRYWTWYWDSGVRSSALVLMAYLAVDPQHPIVPKLTRGLLAARQGGRWSNTQENAFALVALAAYARVYEAEPPHFQGRVWLANRAVTTIDIEGRGLGFEDGFTPMQELLAAIGQAPDTDSGAGAGHSARDQLILERAGQGRMYYRVGLEWASTATDLPTKSEGVEVQRWLRGEQGRLPEGATVTSGALIAMDVTIDVRAAVDHLAVELPLPAGLEAVDMELGKGRAAMKLSGARGRWVSHQELRRDRAVIFADHLSPGTHHSTVFLRATTPGEYVMPAAQAELMYYPEIYGRSTGDRITVR